MSVFFIPCTIRLNSHEEEITSALTGRGGADVLLTRQKEDSSSAE
jgi:hypothetical protein